MDLTSIAQIVSGIATLVVALVLLIQIRQQHKDAEIQIAIMSETMNEKIYNFGNYDQNFIDVMMKAISTSFEDLHENEQFIFRQWHSVAHRRIIQDWRLGRANRDPLAYKIAYKQLFRFKSSLELWTIRDQDLLKNIENNSKTNFKTGLLKIANEAYLEIQEPIQ